MNILQNATRGKIIRPALILIYGPGGIGKSTYASRAPNPFFLGAEEGTDHLDVTRYMPKDFNEFSQAIKELTDDEHDFKSLVIDSLDWVEPLIFEHICKQHGKNSIELCAGGYGKGYTEALNIWIDICRRLNVLRNKRGMNVIMIAHPEVMTVTNPQTQATYQRYEMKLHKKVRAKMIEYVDALFFANFELFMKKEGDEVKAISSGKRVLYGNPNPYDGYDAKNRYGLTQSVSMDIPWDEFIALCKIKPEADIEELQDFIRKGIEKMTDEDIKKKATDTLEKAGKDVVILTKLKARIDALGGN